MAAIQIPENAVGRVGMVAALRHIHGIDDGRLVAVREPAGWVTELLGSDKPVFAWRVEVLGQPVEFKGRLGRSMYVADQCLEPVSQLTAEETDRIIKAQAQEDFDAAKEELLKILEREDLSAEDLNSGLEKAAEQAFLASALELVATPIALRDAGFKPIGDSEVCFRWVGFHNGVELSIEAGIEMFSTWLLSAKAITSRKLTWDERRLPAEALRGEVFAMVLDMCQGVWGQTVVPDILQLGDLYRQHKASMKTLNPGLPRLTVDAKSFRGILRWLAEKFTTIQPETEATISFDTNMLRIDVEGLAYGCPAWGVWTEPFTARLIDMLYVASRISRERRIQLVRYANCVLVNGNEVPCVQKVKTGVFFYFDDERQSIPFEEAKYVRLSKWKRSAIPSSTPWVRPGYISSDWLVDQYWMLGMSWGVVSTPELEDRIRNGIAIEAADGPYPTKEDADYAFDVLWEAPE